MGYRHDNLSARKVRWEKNRGNGITLDILIGYMDK